MQAETGFFSAHPRWYLGFVNAVVMFIKNDGGASQSYFALFADPFSIENLSHLLILFICSSRRIHILWWVLSFKLM